MRNRPSPSDRRSSRGPRSETNPPAANDPRRSSGERSEREEDESPPEFLDDDVEFEDEEDDEDETETPLEDEETTPSSGRRSGRGDESSGSHRRPRTNLRGQRVAVFVDVQNMYHSAKKIYGRNLSYAKLLDYTVRGRTLTRALAYVIDRQGVDQQAFVDHLRHLGFHVRRKELIERPDGSRKGSWDLGLALDALRVAPRVDVVVLVTGDGDFVPLASALAAEGVAVEIACFRESASDSLLQVADDLHLLGRDNLY